MNVYDQPKQTTRLLRSKKISKSSEDKLNVRDEKRNESKFDSSKFDSSKLAVKRESIKMPIKITSLNTIKKDQLNKSLEINEEDDPQKKSVDINNLRAANIDYAQTDENETLQDISTSFSEEKFDSLPEQMTSDVIKKQFHEAFKSMSVVNEEISEQDSSLIEEKKTKIEKQPTVEVSLKEIEQISLNEEKRKSLDKKSTSSSDEKKTSSRSETKTSSLKEEKIISLDKPDIKISFQQVNQMTRTVNALKAEPVQDVEIIEPIQLVADQIDEKFDKTMESNELKDEIIKDENNNEILKDLNEIIINRVTNVEKILTASIEHEQNQMISSGWVLVDSIKEIDEKEDEIKKEESIIEEQKIDLTKQESTDKIKKQESKSELKRQDSVQIEDSESKESLKEKITKIESEESLLREKIEEEEKIEKKEIKTIEKVKSKSQDSSSSSSQSKIKKQTSTSSNGTSSESKIPKLISKKSVKLSSSSTSSTTSSTPSKKSTPSKSSTNKSSNSSKLSPIKKSNTFVLQATEEEKPDLIENSLFEEPKLIEKQDQIEIKNQESIETLKNVVDSSTIEGIKVTELGEKINRTERRQSIVCFEPSLLEASSSNLDDENNNRKKYAKTPIKQHSIEKKISQNDEELSVPNDDDDDSSPQSLNEEITKEQIRKEKNDLIEDMDKKLREETIEQNIKQIKEIEEIAVRKLIDEEQKIIENDVKTVTIKDEKKLKDEKTSSKEESEDKKDIQEAKVDSKSEIIYKKSSIETTEDISERTAYIENMLRTSGYTDKIIEKANEFINGTEADKVNENGIVEEVCVKLVKKNSKDYYQGTNGKETSSQATDQQINKEKSSSKTSEATKKESSKNEFKATTSKRNQNANMQLVSQHSLVVQRKIEKPVTQLKKSTSLSKIPTLSKKQQHVEITTSKFQKQENDQGKITNLEETSFKRNCLKPLQTKSEINEQAMNRPEFKRKKSNLPPKYSIQLDNEQIKKKWNDIKSNEKGKLHHQESYSRLRRTTSNPVISNSFDLIYELNKMPSWARESIGQKNSQQRKANTTSIITQTKRILEKIEKKEIEEVTTRTFINDDEDSLCTKTKKTSREEFKTHLSETEESSISGKQCAICKKIIIPITEDMKFCKRNLRKMLSDSALEIKHCRC